jgi:hypothetical protein
MNFELEIQYLGIIPILLALFAIMAVVMGGKANAEYRMQNAELAERGEKLGGNPKSKPSADNVISQTPVAWHLSSDRRAEIVFWGCIVLITLLLAFGKYFPLYALFYKLPIVNSIRNPNKFLQVFQLALGILSAYGLDSIMGSALKTTDKT